MASTRYNYTKIRTMKRNEESTYGLRYVLNTPGPGRDAPLLMDQQLLWQKWGGNYMVPNGGHPIDLDSAMRGQFRQITRDCLPHTPITATAVEHNIGAIGISESRTTHPSWQVMEMERDNSHPLTIDFQSHAISEVGRPQNSSLIAKDSFDKGIAVHKPI